ncbi:MAG TPA: hypothetical protein VE130_04220 [Nitrososphaeraceae archaeon]|nr:hypothetical protein [Nitrososphaeraceae archaeon]
MKRSAVFSVSSVVGLIFLGLISGLNSFTGSNFAADQSMFPSPDLIQPQLQLVSQSNSSASSIQTQTIINETVVNSSSTAVNDTVSAEKPSDVFGITEIYPTKNGGREWFVNMSNPVNSSNFSITDGGNLTKLPDDAWRINNPHVRMVVNTTGSQENWRDVEITGYIRLSYLDTTQTGALSNSTNQTGALGNNANTGVLSRPPDEEEVDDLVFISRSGRHSSAVPCEGTAYNGGFHTDGSVGWKKEIWHTGGYTNERSNMKIADSFLNKWIGWKTVVYNTAIDNRTGVVLESYIDDSNSNNWTKVSDFIDSGGWYTKSNNTYFFSAGCERHRDHVILEGKPNIIFRTDNIRLDFRDLSVREIQPFNNNLTSVLDLGV